MSNYNIYLLLSGINFKRYYQSILILSLISLIFAYFVEYVMNIAPCPLCLYQRWPYFLLIILSILGLLFSGKRRIILKLFILIFFIASFLAGYHSGVERGVFKPSSLCEPTVKFSDDLSTNDIKNMLYNKPIGTCTKAALKIGGFSMTEWNLALNIFMLCLSVYLGLKKDSHATS